MSVKLKAICVFCGSRKGKRSGYSLAAQELGQLLARENITLVYGGGNIGLMGVLAKACLQLGGKVTGVIPGGLAELEIACTEVTELCVVESMHERKALMANRASAFIALPGGFGTCDELFEILTWAQLGFHNKPIGLLNIEGFFDPLIRWVDHMVEEGLVKPANRSLMRVADSPPKLLEALKKETPIRHPLMELEP